MIDFKDKDAQVPSAITVVSLLIIAGTLLYMLIVPAPKPMSAVAQQKGRETLRRQIDQAKIDTTQKTALAEQLVYRGSPEDIMAQVLAQLTDRAVKLQVQITAFRPQKTQSLTGLTEIPITVQVSGPYPELLTFVNSLSLNTSRVALRSFQVAASGDASSNVAATVGISVYTPESDADAADTSKSSGGAKSPAATSATAKPMATEIPTSPVAKGGNSG